MSTRSKYVRVKGPEEDTKEAKPDTDIIMKVSDRYGKYISRALTLFFGEDKNFVTIKAAERVIDRALWVAQVIRRKVPDLHQIINITEKRIVDVYEPKEEGLVRVEQQRFLTIVQVTLTRAPTADEKASVGYHPTLPLTVADKLLNKESWKKGELERAARREEQGPREHAENRDAPRKRFDGERRPDRGGDRDQRRDERGDPRRDNRGEPRDDYNRRPREDRGDRAPRGDRGDRAPRGDRGDNNSYIRHNDIGDDRRAVERRRGREQRD